MWRGALDVHRHRKAMAIRDRHDFRTLAAFRLPDTVPSLLGGCESAVTECLLDVKVALVVERLGNEGEDVLQHSGPNPLLKTPMAMVDGQTQIAVMKPNAAASWNVVTRDRTQGSDQMTSWSPDGSAIYYDRTTDVANGIYSVPPLGGGEERLVLENAAAPSALPDGSLLFVRLNRDRVSQLHRFWPASGKISALPVVSFNRAGMTPLVAVLDDKRVVVCGRPVTAQGGADTLHLLDLGSGELRRSLIRLAMDSCSPWPRIARRGPCLPP